MSTGSFTAVTWTKGNTSQVIASAVQFAIPTGATPTEGPRAGILRDDVGDVLALGHAGIHAASVNGTTVTIEGARQQSDDQPRAGVHAMASSPTVHFSF